MTVQFNDRDLEARVLRGLRQGIVAATEAVRNEAIRRVLEPPKTGRIYRRRGIEHQASAPGESPASDTGRLVNSIRTRYADDYLVGIVSASTAYAAFLEFGTSRMEPRPYMRPALAAVDVQGIVEARVAAAIGEGAR